MLNPNANPQNRHHGSQNTYPYPHQLWIIAVSGERMSSHWLHFIVFLFLILEQLVCIWADILISDLWYLSHHTRLSFIRKRWQRHNRSEKRKFTKQFLYQLQLHTQPSKETAEIWRLAHYSLIRLLENATLKEGYS